MISIVIPTLNERKHIGNLLGSIASQDFSEDAEIVVADAGSTDGTLDIIQRYRKVHPRLTVVSGGLPPVARNNGAKASFGDPIIFIDADITLSDRSFLTATVNHFRDHKLAIAAAPLVPKSNKPFDRVVVGSYNYAMHVAKFMWPLGAMCIVASREAFERSGGYPEDVVMAEDHDFIGRCLRHGRYGVLPVPVLMSVRRLEKEGRLNLVGKYIKASAYRVIFGPIKRPIFKYEFQYTDEEDNEKVKES